VITRALAILAVVSACNGNPVRRFPARPPLAADSDMTPFLPRPAVYKAPEIWDTVDNTLFGPLVNVLAVHQTRRAVNVNALDEVPDSSWFTNRIDAMTVEAFVRGPCTDDPPDPAGPWTVIAGKPDGANPGFMVEHASGKRFFFKPDGGRGGERQSVADLIGSRVHYAAGFNTACTRIIYVQPSAFQISPSAKAENAVGDKVPFTPMKLARVLDYGTKRADGAIRAGLSQLLPGKPLGPWVDFGVRPDDPNDVVPHEDRRELRGSYVLGAWISHYDAREQNSMDMWEAPADDAPGYVKHYQLDFGDCLGSMSGWDRVTRRRGHVYEVDWPVAFVELITLGSLPRPWRDPKPNPAGHSLGYFTAEVFSPDSYSTAYPFGPYARVTESDAAWGARILARITPEMVRAVIAAANLTDKVMERELERALLGRRDKLLHRYLTRLSPLARPRIDDAGRLCVVDTRIEGGLSVQGAIAARVHGTGTTLVVQRSGTTAESCVGPLASSGDYAVIELRADATNVLRVHLYRRDGSFYVAGVDRN
jgi:hypothetical protein